MGRSTQGGLQEGEGAFFKIKKLPHLSDVPTIHPPLKKINAGPPFQKSWTCRCVKTLYLNMHIPRAVAGEVCSITERSS